MFSIQNIVRNWKYNAVFLAISERLLADNALALAGPPLYHLICLMLMPLPFTSSADSFALSSISPVATKHVKQ
jgi:hypothetical protein